jgi:hypothetical protein
MTGERRANLQGKLAQLKAEISIEEQREAAEKAMAEARSTFTDLVGQAIGDAEASTDTGLQLLRVGIWAYYDTEGALQLSFQPVGDDGLPLRAAPRRRRGASRSRRTDGGFRYYLQDGRGPYETTLAALDALGIPEDQRGRYYHRWDRLPKELQAQIERRPYEPEAQP